MVMVVVIAVTIEIAVVVVEDIVLAVAAMDGGKFALAAGFLTGRVQNGFT